ncbi:hypothetical protein EJ02DRAFT_196275 [Clathrospora elynae]|uniref:Uncharacterized protein n=1 Tax=Clathrospora elynae TaxID=706981 RepID=A0A6A5T3Y7_9PLEO|nr:hypothetical protein EJ02DRAFT_196275 [Clathrospora elynae]
METKRLRSSSVGPLWAHATVAFAIMRGLHTPSPSPAFTRLPVSGAVREPSSAFVGSQKVLSNRRTECLGSFQCPLMPAKPTALAMYNDRSCTGNS